jgi:hypothetical protein
MTNEDKARLYQNALYQHDQLTNKINNIKAQNFELNAEQEREIRTIQAEQGRIMATVQNLLMR